MEPADVNRAPTALIAHPDDATWDDLQTLLAESGFRAVRAATLEEVKRLAAETLPRLLLLRVSRDDGHVLPTLYEVEAANSQMVVVVTSERDDFASAAVCMKIGVQAVMTEPLDHDRLALAISGALGRTIHTRDPIDEEAARMAGIQRLSSRECDAMQTFMGGHTSAAITAQVGIHPRTAKEHRARSMHQSGGTGRANVIRGISSL